ncbi:MAG: DUF4190 domain-containing protein [Ilumatobacteraceae bacterium]
MADWAIAIDDTVHMSNTPPPPPPPPTGGQPAQWNNPPGPATYGGGGRQEHPAGTTVLVLGILGLVVCGLLAPVAWIKGNTAKREMDAQPGVEWTNRGNITAGRICGMIGTGLIALGLLFVALVVVVAVAGN